MRENGSTDEGFKKRKNYSRKKSRQGKTFPWVNTPVGRTMKTLIGLIGDSVACRSVTKKRNFSEQGASKERLHGELVRIAPWFPVFFEMISGYPLNQEIVYNRYHKMYYQNGGAGEGGRPVVSSEHYLHCKKLRPCATKVEQLFLKGKAITFAEAEEAGTLKK